MMRSRWVIGIGLIVGLGALAATAATPRARRLARAHRLLAQIKLVDGMGSGLDAELFQGLPATDFAGVQHGHANLAPANHGHADLAPANHGHADLEDRTRCIRVVGDVVVFDGCG